MYAIVRCGGRQEKASVDDVLTVDKLPGDVGATVTLPAVLVVDDGKVISDPAELGGYQVTAEILGAALTAQHLPHALAGQCRHVPSLRDAAPHRLRQRKMLVFGIAAADAEHADLVA